ncbi:Calx-beta domain-containing protein [Kaarinaea lacus]
MSAAQFDVDTTDDLGDDLLSDNVCHTALNTCSLRAAIQQANETPGPDVINLPAGTYTLTLGSAGEDEGLGGDLDIFSDIEIIGEDAATTIIDGDGRDRVIHVTNLAYAVFPLAHISNVTIRNGYQTYEYGAGIYNQGSLTLSNVIVTANNMDPTYNAVGAGIYSINFATLILDNSTVSFNNSEGDGAGIYTQSYTYILNSTISDNNSPASGGGLVSLMGSLYLYNVTIDNNHASVYGGGLDVGTESTMIDVVITNNTAYQGAGIFLGPAVHYIEGALIDSNVAICEGGGLMNTLTGTANSTITASTISNNTAACNGGAIRNNSNLILINTTVSGNKAVDISDINPENGGGIYMGGGGANITITNSTIANNEASGEGANIYSGTVTTSYGTVTTSNSIIASPVSATNCSRVISSNGYNIDSDGTCGINAIGDSMQDPLITALADNGGPTPTHGLDAASPAIDAVALNNCPPTDQRRFYRNDSTCDIGALEVGSTMSVGGAVQFETGAYSVGEGAGTVSLNVTRTGGSEGPISVAYATMMNSSASDQSLLSDYDAVYGILKWDDNDTASKEVLININEDIAVEGNETFKVILFPPGGNASLGGNAEAIVTITDNDVNPGVFAFSQTSLTVSESVGQVNLTIVRSLGSDGPVSVELLVQGGSAQTGTDYNLATGTLNFAGGETEKQISLSIVDDALWEQDETIIIALSNPQNGATLGADDQETITISANDRAAGSLSFAQATYTVSESDGAISFVVNRSGGTDGEITIDYVISSGSATAGTDYTFTPGTLNFANGETSKNISVTLTDDADVETDETLVLALQNPLLGASIGLTASTTITIQDNDTGVVNSPSPGSDTNNNGGGGGGGGGSTGLFVLLLLPLIVLRYFRAWSVNYGEYIP